MHVHKHACVLVCKKPPYELVDVHIVHQGLVGEARNAYEWQRE